MERCEDCIHKKVCAEVESLQCRRLFAWYKAEWGCPHFVASGSEVAKLEQEKDELVRKIFEELGDYAADFVAGHIDDDNFLRAIYTLKAKYTNPVQCRDCAHLMFSDCYGECSKGHRGIVKPDDSCEYGEKFRRE